MFTHILLAVDGSRQTPRVVALAADLAAASGARVSVTCCVDASYTVDSGSDPAGEVTLYQPACEEENAAARIVREAMKQLQALGDKVTGQIIVGDAAQALVAEARQQEASVIVMGHRHRGLVDRLLKGSVCADIMATAPCPVLVEVRD